VDDGDDDELLSPQDDLGVIIDNQTPYLSQLLHIILPAAHKMNALACPILKRESLSPPAPKFSPLLLHYRMSGASQRFEAPPVTRGLFKVSINPKSHVCPSVGSKIARGCGLWSFDLLSPSRST
jgi:hypothetical protein